MFTAAKTDPKFFKPHKKNCRPTTGFFYLLRRAAAFSCNGGALQAKYCVFLAENCLAKKVLVKFCFFWQLAGGSWQVAVGRWQLAGGHLQVAVSRWQVACGPTVWGL